MDLKPTLPGSGALGLNEASAALPQSVAPAAADPAEAAYRKKATEAAVKFESFFIGHMLKQMRNSTKELSAEDSIYKNSINSDMLDMADGMVADQMAHQRAFGIADAILRQLVPPPAPPAAAPMPNPPAAAPMPNSPAAAPMPGTAPAPQASDQKNVTKT